MNPIKNIIKCILLLLTVCISVSAQQKFTSIPYDAGKYSKDVYNTVEINNNYYFLCNELASSYNSKSFIYKTSSSGIILDSMIFSAISDTCMVLTDIYRVNNVIKVFGVSSNYNPANQMPVGYDLLQYNLDENLNIINSYVIPISDTNEVTGMNGINLIGDKVFYCFLKKPQPGFKSLIFVTDTVGNYLFSNKISETGDYSDIIKHPNNNDYISYSGGFGSSDIYILNNNLDSISHINSSSYSTDVHFALADYSDDKFMLGHILRGYVIGSPDYSYCIKIIDTLGNIFKTATLPIDTACYSALPFNKYTLDATDKNNIYFGGNYNSDPGLILNSKFQIANLDSNLNIRWCKNFGGDFPYRIYTYYGTSDGGCLITAKRKIPVGAGTFIEPVVFKISNTGIITAVTSFSKNLTDQVIIYPNPAKEEIHLLSTSAFDNSKCYFYTSTGALVKTTTIHNGDNILKLSGLVAGTYFYKIVNRAGESISGSLLKTD